MTARKNISNTLSVSAIEDGYSPNYFDEWFAWSNVASTANVTTEPTPNGGWYRSIPSQGSYSYLWRKSIYNVFNESTRTYSQEAAQYFRMSGTNGTSINTRGQVANASSRGSGTATLTNGTTITLSNGDAVTQLDDGHLYQWVTEGGGTWLDLGQFKGESGITYYTHIVWAENIVYSGSAITSIVGYAQTKSPNDTTHLWMGTYVDQNSGDPTSGSDPILKQYTWSYTKGVQGDGGVVYSIECSPESVKIASGDTSATWSGSVIFYKTVGGTRNLYAAYAALYSRTTNGAYTRLSRSDSKITGINSWSANVTTNISALVVYMGDSQFSSSSLENSAPTDYLCKYEIGVVKDGDNGKDAVDCRIIVDAASAYVENGTISVNLTCHGVRISGTTITDPYTQGSMTINIGSATPSWTSVSSGASFVLSGYTATWSSIGSPKQIKLSYTTSDNAKATALVPISVKGEKGNDSIIYNIVESSANAVVSANNRLTASLTCTIDRIVGATTTHAYKNANGSVLASIGSDTVTLTYNSSNGVYTLSGYDANWVTKGRPTHILLSYYISSTLYASLTVSITLTGKMGRSYYFGGIWENVDANEQFIVSDVQAPFFEYTLSGQKRHAVYNSTTNGTYTKSQMTPLANGLPDTSTANTAWELMTDDFKYLITEAIFSNFAKLGSSIFNHDYMFSQWGKANVNSTNLSNDYQNINPSFCSSSSLTLVDGTLNISGTTRILLSNVYMRQGFTYQFGINGLRGTGSGSLTIGILDETGVSKATITFTNSSSSYKVTNVTVDTTGYYDIVVYCTDASTAGQITSFSITEQSWSASSAGFIPSILLNLLSGYAHFAGGKVKFQPDGSGRLAGGNISWNKNGDASFRGTVNATSGSFAGAVNATSGTFVNGTFTNVNISGNSSFAGSVNIKSLYNTLQYLDETQTVSFANGTTLEVFNGNYNSEVVLTLPDPSQHEGIVVKVCYPVLTRVATGNVRLSCSGKIAISGVVKSSFCISQNAFISLYAIDSLWFLEYHNDNEILSIQ